MVTDDDRPQWRVKVIGSAQKDIKQIHKGSAKTDLHTELKDKLGRAPLGFGEPLRGDLYPARRLRIGKFRAVYLPVEKEGIVYILSVRHRGEVYQDGRLREYLRDILNQIEEDGPPSEEG